MPLMFQVAIFIEFPADNRARAPKIACQIVTMG
jgi:hypothetical protein